MAFSFALALTALPPNTSRANSNTNNNLISLTYQHLTTEPFLTYSRARQYRPINATVFRSFRLTHQACFCRFQGIHIKYCTLTAVRSTLEYMLSFMTLSSLLQLGCK
ncbi:hypothetical protein M378DRAFT_341142 [Amanita muscaria Koide BX008]|uniref:Secreted protein n=1 Tax=Amanita muscaria (strain Koide BX008) TaxID=946122 RepID=A0A0C2WA67_AMAMK|nr:hypothetical protein M378DRAFT_341142 [Amanita muscaria Koide BX008]